MSCYFSVIVPTYNRAHLLGETIRCILRQTFSDFELIIVDDASTDETGALISSIEDLRIVYLKNEVNMERSASRNRGIAQANGKFICFCDSDDHWRENHLEVLFNEIKSKNEQEAMYFTAMTWNFPNRKQDIIFPLPPQDNCVEYVVKNQIGTPTTAFARIILDNYIFRTDLKINEDVELFSRIVAIYPLVQIPESTVDVIIHPENTRGLHKNYISPQIHAMKIIFGNPLLKGKISKQFKKDRMRSLRHQLINHYATTGEILKLQLEILKFICHYPGDYQNKSKLVMMVYSLGGVSSLKKIIQ